MSLDWHQDVLDFHDKFAPHIPAPTPAAPPGGDAYYGLGFLREELAEIEAAAKAGDVPGVADGLADLIYVAIRKALIWGVDLRPVWDEVHRANLAKTGTLRGDGKLIKGPGFVPPDIVGVLKAQGWVEAPPTPVDRGMYRGLPVEVPVSAASDPA